MKGGPRLPRIFNRSGSRSLPAEAGSHAPSQRSVASGFSRKAAAVATDLAPGDSHLLASADGHGLAGAATRIGRAAVAVALVVCAAVALVIAQPADPRFRPFDKLRAVPSLVEGRLKPEATGNGNPEAQQPASPTSSDAERQARAVCGSCHGYAPPDILPARTGATSSSA